MRVTIIGGDERAMWLHRLLIERGESARLICRQENDPAALQGADVVVLPYPYAVRDGQIPCLCGQGIDAAELLRAIPTSALLIAGDGAEPYLADAMAERPRLCALHTDEAFLCENAEISAEGAVCYAMRAMDGLLRGTACVVTGYGRFGKELAWRLHALGATVTVVARKEDARKAAQRLGMLACAPDRLRDVLPCAQAVFNTVPAPMLGVKELRLLPADALLFELASKPYGIDPDAARGLALHTLVIGGIPARYAPRSAAEAILRAIRRAIRRGEACQG